MRERAQASHGFSHADSGFAYWYKDAAETEIVRAGRYNSEMPRSRLGAI
jgi:hypothetical protein